MINLDFGHRFDLDKLTIFGKYPLFLVYVEILKIKKTLYFIKCFSVSFVIFTSFILLLICLCDELYQLFPNIAFIK